MRTSTEADTARPSCRHCEARRMAEAICPERSPRSLRSLAMTAFSLLALMAGGIAPRACGEQAVPLTWQDCVRLASRNNPDLISALRAMQASRAQYSGSYNGIFPHLSVSNSYSDTKSSSLPESKSWQAEGTASLDLIDFSQWASIQSASACHTHRNSQVRKPSQTTGKTEIPMSQRRTITQRATIGRRE